MKKKTIIYIVCIVIIILILACVVYFALQANKKDELIDNQKIIIEKYDEQFKVEKSIEITDKKQIKEINKICENLSLEQDDTNFNLAIRNDVKLDLGNKKFFMLQLDITEYCYYEDESSNTKLVIKMPEGLLEKVNLILEQN